MTYYSDFKNFLEEIFPIKKGYSVQVESKLKNSTNKPDFTIRYKGIVLFIIEAKKPFTPIDNLILDNINQSQDQIYRYRNEGVQLLITDFIDIGLLDPKIPNNSSSKQSFSFKCKLIEKSHQTFIPAKDAISNFQSLLSRTCEESILTISNVRNLIFPLSILAKELRKKVIFLLNNSRNKSHLTQNQIIAAEYLTNIKDDFKKSIFKEDVDDEDNMFADLFAQTIVYGGFSAWIKFCQRDNKPSNFKISIIGDYLPFGSFLRELFLDLKNKTPREFKGIFSEIEKRFQKTEYKKIMNNSETLISTFYSDFLKLYDPKIAKDRGVVYTPHEIVEFMIDGIDFMLKRWLNKPNGIISETLLENSNENPIDQLRILDPAAGTNAFACGLLHKAKIKFNEKYTIPTLAQGAFNNWVKNEFFNNMFAFEILMAPYVLGHIRTFLTLEELGLVLNAEENKLKSFLMNTLMTPPLQRSMDEWLFNNQNIGREIKQALKIRDKRDIFIIMGNPPYNLSSQNNCVWINEKIDDYKKGLKEKNKKIISDDYVKFLRFGQWKIEQVGTGILAMITNSRYLEGQMFPIMRESLRKTFDHIYIVNLHGDMRKKEAGNPFDIRVGVCIAFMVRIDNSPNKNAAIHYMDVPNPTREEKFLILSDGFHEERFKLLSETKKNYFVDIDTELLDRYESFPSIDSFFVASPTSGIMVGKDHLLVDTDRKNVETNLKLFFDKDFDRLDELKIKTHDSKSWKKDKVYAKTNLKHAMSKITPIQYRGFDFRYIAYDRSIVEGHRMGYIDQISQKNPAITVSKSSRKANFCTAFIANHIIEKCYMSVTDTSYAFLLNKDGKSNIDKKSSRIPFKCSDEDFFYYIYGILFSMTYRKRYDEYLLKGFPRIPITKNRNFFIEMSELGYKLAQAHLLNIKIDPKLDVAEIPPDQWIVKDFYYSPEEECLYLDKTKNSWIKGISKEMWSFKIGDIPQLSQFLKSRKFSSVRKWNTLQRSLSHRELIIFLKICSAIMKTIEILPIIDSLFQQIDNL